MEENRALKDQRIQMDQVNNQLKEDLQTTRDELQATKEENIKLKKELKELRHSLTRLAQATTPEVSSEGDGSDRKIITVLEKGTDQAALPLPPSSDTATASDNAPQDLIT